MREIDKILRFALLLVSLTNITSSARLLTGTDGGSSSGALRPPPNSFVPSSTSTPFSTSIGHRPLPAIKVDPTGKVYTTQILKQQLANELGLPLRDFRIVDPSFPSQIQATFTSRPNAILFSIENIKVVVQHNEALIFSPYQPEVQEFVPALQQQIAQAKGDLQEGIIPLEGSAGRFEHIVIEAALNVVCTNLLRRVRSLSPAVASTLDGLRAESRGLDVIITQVDTLLPLKNKIDELKKRVKEIKRAITDVLNNDEDLMMMYLAIPPDINNAGTATSFGKSNEGRTESVTNVQEGQKRMSLLQKDTMSLEMLFENYLNEVEWIASEVEEIVDEIKNTEENVVLQLDLLRNRILRFELLLSISSFVVTCGALVTGLFGMNLLSHFESHGSFFYVVSGFILASMTAIFATFVRYGKREKLF